MIWLELELLAQIWSQSPKLNGKELLEPRQARSGEIASVATFIRDSNSNARYDSYHMTYRIRYATCDIYDLDREPSYWCTRDTSFWIDDSRLSISWRFTNSTSFEFKTRIWSIETLKNRFVILFSKGPSKFTIILADVLRTGTSISPEPSLSKDQKPIAPPNVQKTPNQTDNTPTEKSPQPGKFS